MSSADSEDLIARLAGQLQPDDREPFRAAAVAALIALGDALGPGSAHRAVEPVWLSYFRPPAMRGATWTLRQTRLVQRGKWRRDREEQGGER